MRNFDEQNFDESIVAFMGKVLTGKIERENFDESLAVHQNSSDFSTVKVLRYTVSLGPEQALQKFKIAFV